MCRGAACTFGALIVVVAAASPAWSVVPDAPPAPTVVGGPSEITVTFSPPDNGSPILDYTATCTAGANAVSRSHTSSPIIVFGLVNGTSYTCTVDATNADGTSAESPPSAAAVPLAVPGAPTAVSAVAHDAQITVTFVPPADDGGSAITGYTATCASNDGTVVVSTGGASSPIVVTPVTDGKSYTCDVNAANAVGTGPDSSPSASVFPVGVPAVPAPPTITSGTNMMQVAFVPPAQNGASITSYTATCTSTDGGETATQSGPGSPINVTGLTDGNTYTCDVDATNSVGTSAVSGESAPAVAVAVPNAPVRPTVAGGPSRVVVSFVVPVESAGFVYKTTATCTSSNGGVARSSVADPQDSGEGFSPMVVTGLTNGKTYTCTVTATNGVGTGPPSPASAAVVPRTSPGAPIGVKAVSGNAAGATGPVTVSFGGGAARGSAITAFRATCTDVKYGRTFVKTGTRSPLRFTSLATGQLFSCVVVDTSLGGTSVPSAAVQVIVGAPAQPTFTKISQKNHGVTLTFLAPAANGSPITTYVARCTSTDGGVTQGGTSTTSQVAVNNMSLNTTYACLVTADNARGAGAAVKVAPIRITN